MKVLISDDVAKAFEGLHLGFLEIREMKIAQESEKVTELLRDISGKVCSGLTIETVKDRADFRAYRDFFWKQGVDPTKIRPASEALVRRILKGSSIPRINDFVDAYNLASIETGVPIAAFDLDAIEEDIVLRFSVDGEQFLGIGMVGAKALGKGTLIMSSGEEVVAMYPYRDADASRITTDTTGALVISCGVPGIPPEALLDAAKRARDYIISVCGGHPSKIGSV
jgi:DNA/RNA-binding domain of Phe-tRNA-synthetase-like protein